MFIKLHCANGNEIRVNFDLVESYGEINNNSYYGEQEQGLTYICPINLAEDERPYVVKETPEEIDKILMYGLMYGPNV